MNALRRALFVALLAMPTLLLAAPVSAKTEIIDARITGPGLDRPLRIEGSDTSGLSGSGIDVMGGLDDARADSLEGLGLTVEQLGARYLVVYRFGLGGGDSDLVRQHLYPYAEGGPVTFTPPGQEMSAGIEMSITSGWYESSHPCSLCGGEPAPPEEAAQDFFGYLVAQGMPGSDPLASTRDSEPLPETAPAVPAAPWNWPPGGLAGLTALSLTALFANRRGWWTNRGQEESVS